MRRYEAPDAPPAVEVEVRDIPFPVVSPSTERDSPLPVVTESAVKLIALVEAPVAVTARALVVLLDE